MPYSYIEAIGIGFPEVKCHVVGDPVYENIVWDSGAPLPSKETLDQWIIANPNAASQGIVLTKYEFRKLFTFNERVAIDSAPSNTNIPAQYRAMINTFMKDLEMSGVVFLTANPDLPTGLGLLEQVGLIAPGRAAQILANQAPA